MRRAHRPKLFLLLERASHAEDGRAQRLDITAAGRRAVARALPLVAEMRGVLAPASPTPRSPSWRGS